MLTMRVNSARHRSLCASCTKRVRVGKRYVVDPEDPKLIHHEACFDISMAKKRR